MKNILLLCHDDSGQEARFQAALDLARALEGHLLCLDVVVPPPAMIADAFGAVGAGSLTADTMLVERENRARLTARLERDDVPWEWADVTGELGPSLARSAALADVIVLNRELDDYPLPDMAALVGDLVVSSGTPVLAVPAYSRGLGIGRALVAWNGSTAAAAAMRAAVPLLTLADRVTLLEVEGDSIAAPAEEAAAYLSRHGVHAEILRVPADSRGTAATIAEQAAKGRFDYVVTGGFGHRRFVERLLGGVTRYLLTHSPIPLFLAH